MRLAILVDDEAVWPHPGVGDEASDFDPEEVLSYLVDSWPSLLITQTFPIQFPPNQMPRSLTGLAGAAEERWAQLGEADAGQMEDEQSRLDAFLYYHDLSQMKFGAGLEEFYVLKSGSRMRIETFGRKIDGINFPRFVTEIKRLGNEAARLLGNEHFLAQRWDARDQIDPVTVIALISGVPLGSVISSRDRLEPLISEVGQRRLEEIANDNGNPIYAAARGAGALGVTSLYEVTNLVRQLGVGDGRALREWYMRTYDKIRDIKNPTDQGIRAAGLVRDWLEQPTEVDLNGLSDKLKIHVRRVDIPDGRLDGIAVTAGAHGPAILLNTKTRRQGAGPNDLERSLRFTWAHEIGHLLMDDQEEWPVLVDIFEDQQRISRDVETRANAFAAYLLLPPTTALQWWEEMNSPRDWQGLEEVLDRLTNMFGLPRITASRQLERGLPSHHRDLVRDAFRRNISDYDGRD